ncbi:hypothetical protein AWB72_01266 [Caballeronia concitans]|uniref:Uncharacterized protein n=1 Tax=Caballeronia concitans TaxID=1777133 RepID=A0A658QTD1_9BURK|nr:hypothetical protein BurMR1_2212 [Burkholderia sp. MR1]SAL19876.1 hypothetical protein AWB72_01266 [Caballeronia concitans]
MKITGPMRPEHGSYEKVLVLVERADALRLQMVAVPVKDLRHLLRLCESVSAQRALRVAGNSCEREVAIDTQESEATFFPRIGS